MKQRRADAAIRQPVEPPRSRTRTGRCRGGGDAPSDGDQRLLPHHRAVPARRNRAHRRLRVRPHLASHSAHSWRLAAWSLAGSGVSISIPEGWTVEVASPDPDVTAAPPASAWEALRTSPPDGIVTCSVYVGVPPAGHPLDPEGFPNRQFRDDSLAALGGWSCGPATHDPTSRVPQR